MLKFEKKQEVLDLLLRIKKNNLKFSPQYITNSLGISLEDVIAILDDFTNDEMLEKVFTIKCDNCNYSFFYTDSNKIPFNKELECGYGHNFIVTPYNAYVWYRFTEEAKQYKKKLLRA